MLVPLRAEDGFDSVRAFARAVAEFLADAESDLLIVEQRKAKRGGRVSIDVLRNAYGQTVMPAYAVPARPGAPVSTPIEWDELDEVDPAGFTVGSLPVRLEQRGDPWKGLRRHARGLLRARERLERRLG